MAVRHVPAEFTTIQDAVNQSAPGDTIRVAGGVYEESVTIGADRDRLAIIGSGRVKRLTANSQISRPQSAGE